MQSPRKSLIDLRMSVAHHHEVYLHSADHTLCHQQARISDKKIVLVLGDAVVDLGRFNAVERNKCRLQDNIYVIPGLTVLLVEKRNGILVVVERYRSFTTISTGLAGRKITFHTGKKVGGR